ncbi:glucose-repressible protein Grg1 [Fusarium tricinctum]|uniref:Glucose-repressible protein Grg1 n=1 Tax=Fusarium tricinctum TaxID=61284 RepID=A0A8K0W6Y5_9HYPO|nr:glucose-repressible protein Grg1 [Fusarium tricinctum]
MESIKQAGNYVAETVQSVTSGASKEANKEVAKDSNVPISTRLSAGKDAIGDKIDETGHDKKADVHKEAAKQ